MTINVEKTLKKIEDFYGEVPLYLMKYRKMKKISPLQSKSFFILWVQIKYSHQKKLNFCNSWCRGNNGSHCLAFHIKQALTFGATEEEIFHVILIAALMSESSSLAVGLRRLKEIKNERGITTKN